VTAVAAQPKVQRTRKALLLALVGTVAVGLAAATFLHFDTPVSELTLGGTVTNTWRERGGFVYCQVRLSDGVVINEQCDSLPVGAQVTVDRYRHALSRRTTYGTVRRDK